MRSIVRAALLIGALAAMFSAAPALATAPPNDAFASAQALLGNSASIPGTTFGATLEAGEPSHFVSGNGSVWYSWTASENLVLRLDTCAGPGATKVQLYTGSAVNALQEVAPRPDSPQCAGVTGGDLHDFNVAAGTTYAISVIEYGTDTPFTLALSASPSPSNDDFSSADDLGQELSVDVDGTTVGTTMQPGEPGYFGPPGDGGSVWYRWTAPKRMRVWIDNCDAASASEIGVYTGGSVDSLRSVSEHHAVPDPSPCGGDNLYGARTEFLATAGTTYVIRVHTDLYAQGAFHLRMREIEWDGSLTQEASETKIKKGKTVTYTVVFHNLGTLPMEPWIDLISSKPGKLAGPVVGTKYLSLDTTAGKCERATFFSVHPGAICKPGSVAPGDTVRIVAKVRPSQSMSQWVATDYAQGSGDPIYDDNPDNDPFADVVTRVKPKHHHH